MNPISSGLSSIIALTGIPKPVAQIVTTIAPKMFAGTITVPEIIAAVLSYAVEDAKRVIDKTYKDKFPKVPAHYWLAIFEQENQVWATTFMQNASNKSERNYKREQKGNYWFPEAEKRLAPFLAEQLKQISTQIKPEAIKKDYGMLIEFLKQQSSIPSETVDYILNLIVHIFSTPEPFLEVILAAFAGNIQALYSELKTENWYPHLERLTFFTGVSHEGICIYVDTKHFNTTSDPFSHKKRAFLPVGEFFEKMLEAPEGYYERNFENILADVMSAVGMPPDAPETTEKVQTTDTTPPISPKKKNVIQFSPRAFPHLHTP